jgi:hypothetical protein
MDNRYSDVFDSTNLVRGLEIVAGQARLQLQTCRSTGSRRSEARRDVNRGTLGAWVVDDRTISSDLDNVGQCKAQTRGESCNMAVVLKYKVDRFRRSAA